MNMKHVYDKRASVLRNTNGYNVKRVHSVCLKANTNGATHGLSLSSDMTYYHHIPTIREIWVKITRSLWRWTGISAGVPTNTVHK